MIRDHFIHYQESSLHYATAGNGTKPLLVFHGFGQNMDVFEFFTRSLSRQYTFYVFDLYFHGKSTWAHGERPLSKQEWKEILSAFFSRHNIEQFSLAGFSLGAKFVLSAVESFPSRVSEIFLIAPDGIKTSFWYSMATYPQALRRLFRSMINRPERFLGLVRLLNNSRLVDHGLLRFAEFQMNTEEKRKRVYYSWVVFRHLKPDLAAIASAINNNHIRLTMIVGKYDKVITPASIQRFLKKIDHYSLKVLDSGHTGLINESLPYFADPERAGR